MPTFELTSTDISEGVTLSPPQLSKRYGVEGGQDQSPSLSWSGFPVKTTKSFVVFCLDPDAERDPGFWHWIVYNIPATTTSLPTGAGDEQVGAKLLPPGAKMLFNSANWKGFCGAAPPIGHGQHRYIFCVTALKCENLAIEDDAKPGLDIVREEDVVGRAFLTAIYSR